MSFLSVLVDSEGAFALKFQKISQRWRVSKDRLFSVTVSLKIKGVRKEL